MAIDPDIIEANRIYWRLTKRQRIISTLLTVVNDHAQKGLLTAEQASNSDILNTLKAKYPVPIDTSA